MRKDRWNTYAISGYTHQVGKDPRATGGVHVHTVKRGPAGWLRRTSDSNGQWESHGPVEAISNQKGEALYEQAKSF